MGQMLLKFIRVLASPIRMLITPKGQVIARGFVYAGMTCAVISLLLMARTHWALPFLAACFFFTVPGLTAISHQHISQVTLFLCLTYFQTLGPGLFDLGQQADQQNHLQQQLIILENQRIGLYDQQVALKAQFPLLVQQQQQLEQAGNNEGAAKRKEAIGKINVSLSDVKTGLQSLENFITYDYWLIEENAWNLPSDSLTQDNQQMIKNDGQETQYYRDKERDFQQQIVNNNDLLPNVERVHTPARGNQIRCVTGYPCGVPSWQQTIVESGQRLMKQPLSETWIFWLVLPCGLLVLFVVAPKSLRRGKEITYKILYNGLSFQLRDPRKKVRTTEAYPYLVKLRVWITPLTWRVREDYQHDYVYFDLGPETTIYNVYLQQNSNIRRGKNQPANLPQVSFGASKGKVILQPMQRAPQRTAWGVSSIDLYISVGHPIKDLCAEASVSGLEHIRELGSPAYFAGLRQAMRETGWITLALSLFFSFEQCSHYFFDGISFFQGPLSYVGLELFVLWLVFKGIEIVIEKVAMKEQTVHEELVPVAMQPIAEQAGDD